MEDYHTSVLLFTVGTILADNWLECGAGSVDVTQAGVAWQEPPNSDSPLVNEVKDPGEITDTVWMLSRLVTVWVVLLHPSRKWVASLCGGMTLTACVCLGVVEVLVALFVDWLPVVSQHFTENEHL